MALKIGSENVKSLLLNSAEINLVNTGLGSVFQLNNAPTNTNVRTSAVFAIIRPFTEPPKVRTSATFVIIKGST